MKYFVQIAYILIFSIFIIACEKEAPPSENIPPVEDEEVIVPGEQEFGWARGLKEGETWEASAQALLFDTSGQYIDLILTTYNEEGFLRGSLVLNEIPLFPGQYEIKFGAQADNDNFVGASYGNSISHGDVLMAFYNALDDFPESSLELITVDTVTNLCEGYISKIALEIVNGGGGNYPDTVFFENIDFSCEIRDSF